ncbi:hypothetical protein BN946_scf184943.g53 [Trametes cinnabarina]|uniref:Uncharacterized protein n=1 Tax=Pycnoporus cinnabarinus TaxID=5643 RepID=A0A060SHV7_PYCCI|nr:hypothetical protein BN946_scf184943.g53 [Trametes cinnabarina]
MGSSTTPYKRRYGHQSSMLNALSAFVHRLLRLPMTDNQRTLSGILQRTTGYLMPVDELADTLKSAYVHAVQNNQLNPDRARICHLSFMKERQGLQHEYILAYVTLDGLPWAHGADVRLGVIKCERNVDAREDGTANHFTAALSNTPSSGSPSMSSPGSKSPLTRIHAADRFFIYDPSHFAAISARSTDACCHTHHFYIPNPAPTRLLDPTGIPPLEFDPPETCPLRSRDDTSPPSLYDLAAAAIALNLSAPLYIIWTNQCYWFAAALYYILGGRRAVEGAAQSPGVIEETSHVTAEASGVIQGTFRGMFTFASQADIEALYNSTVRDLFDEELKKLYRALREAVEGALQMARENARMARENARMAHENARMAHENAEKERALAEKDQALSQKDQALSQKDQALAEKDRALARLAAELEAFKLHGASGQPGPSRAPQV